MTKFVYPQKSTKFKVVTSSIINIFEPDKSNFLLEEIDLMSFCSDYKIHAQNSGSPEMIAQIIGKCAAMSLLEEVNTSPKPGLVDRLTNGAHKDMNLLTFYCSAQALEPFFIRMAEQGIKEYKDLEQCFRNIREIGIEAEASMYAATGGVNTHKGLIFSLGILCASVGSCYASGKIISVDQIMLQEQQMVRRILMEELDRLNKKTECFARESHGENLYKKMGVTGVRGEAIDGYRTVREIGLPVMIEGMKQKKDFNQIKLQTLMTFMNKTEDTNVLSRTNMQTLLETQKIAEEYLQEGGVYAVNGISRLIELDKYFTEKNISHGGCADLLAISIFLVSMIQIAQS